MNSGHGLVKKDSSPIKSVDKPKPTTPLLKRTNSQLLVLQAQNLVLWKKPFSTFYHFLQYLYDSTIYLCSEVVRNKFILFCGIIVLISFCFLDNLEGPHQVSTFSISVANKCDYILEMLLFLREKHVLYD